MTQAVNLANFANNLDSSGGLNPLALNAATPVSRGGTGVTTTAAAAALFGNLLYPVGSIYINATNSTNPATLLGFGTWVAFGAGRVPVGFNAADPLFDAPEETGGSKDAVVVTHTHTITATQSAHNHYIANTDEGPSWNVQPSSNLGSNFLARGRGQGTGSIAENYALWGTATTPTAGVSSNATPSISASASSVGSAGTNANLQPYITVYMWKRTA